MKKLLIVTLLVIVGLITACQPTQKEVAPVITEAPKPTKTLDGQYNAFFRVWSEGDYNETIEDYQDTVDKLRGIRYATNNLPESIKKTYLLAFMDEMIKVLEGPLSGKGVDYVNERFAQAEANLRAYNKEN
jgi:hypothetical protein